MNALDGSLPIEMRNDTIGRQIAFRQFLVFHNKSAHASVSSFSQAVRQLEFTPIAFIGNHIHDFLTAGSNGLFAFVHILESFGYFLQPFDVADMLLVQSIHPDNLMRVVFMFSAFSCFSRSIDHTDIHDLCFCMPAKPLALSEPRCFPCHFLEERSFRAARCGDVRS